MRSILHSIRFQLTSWLMIMLTLALLVVSAAVYFGLQRTLLDNVDTTLRRAAERSLQVFQQNSIDSASSERDRIQALTLLSLAPTRLVAMDGVVSQSDPLFPRDLAIKPEEISAAQGGNTRFETVSLPSGQFRLLTAPVAVNGVRVAFVQVTQSLETETAALAGLRNLMALVIPAILLLAVAGSALISARAFAPMERVRREVEMIISDTDLSRRVGQRLTADEVGRLARTFDRLLERIQVVVGRERQFAADASHELRSPLTALKGELSLALSRDRDAGEYREVLGGLEAAVDEMSALVEDLLVLARSAGDTGLVLAPLDMSALVGQAADRLAVVAADRHIEFVCGAPDTPMWINGDRLKLQRVLINLIDNALRYTPEGGAVHVTLARNGGQIGVRVSDTGIGIPARHLPHVFERFYRADNARARESGGSGLGLAIAQAIVQAHGGRITIESQIARGSTFSLWLPAILSS